MPTAGLELGCPTLEDSLHVLWERELPKTFSGTEKTYRYVPTYIFNIMKQEVKSVMAARFAIRGVR